MGWWGWGWRERERERVRIDSHFTLTLVLSFPAKKKRRDGEKRVAADLIYARNTQKGNWLDNRISRLRHVMHFNEPERRRHVLQMESVMSASTVFRTLLILADQIVIHYLAPYIAV